MSSKECPNADRKDDSSIQQDVGSETIPASSPVAVVNSSTAAATTTTAAVGTNAIREVATLKFSPTSSVHGTDFAITNANTKVPLSAGLGAVQTIDATTTALPTAATLGHPDTPNATQSATAKVGSETIPASSPVAAVTSSTAAAKTTTTAAVGTNVIKEVATLTFSTTSSDHGADFAITNPTTNVPLSAGLGGVQTIDATTTALPTATTLGHPVNPNATQSAAAKVVVRNGTPTTTSTTTATRMVDLEAGGGSSNCRRVHASVSDPVLRPLPDSVSAPNCTDCVAVAVAVAVVAETLNPTDTTAGSLVGADPFATTFRHTVSNPRGVEVVESIANINPILLITRPVGNVYLVSTIVTLPAAGAVEDVDATVTADDDADADAAVIAATTPIHFASLACR
ncbi:hypothetical protein SprV_0401453700 [Sparganum proliferum]